MRTIPAIIYVIVPIIGTIIALLSAFPVPPRSPGRATVAAHEQRNHDMIDYAHAVEQQRLTAKVEQQQRAETARLRELQHQQWLTQWSRDNLYDDPATAFALDPRVNQPIIIQAPQQPAK